MYEYALLDVGGTFIKYGFVMQERICDVGLFPVNEKGSREEVIRPLVDFLRLHPAKHVVISIPGPMDYPTGTSHMQHKFVSIAGISLKQEIEAACPGTNAVFLHDGVAFMLGEALDGAAKGCESAAGVMLGTGLGFVLWQAGQVLIRPAYTPCCPLWSKPYLDSIAENYVSGHGIAARWTAETGEKATVKQIADLARSGDQRAQQAMSAAGTHLGTLLAAHLAGKKIEKIVIGGQIAKSLDLMSAAIAANCPVPFEAATHLDDAALRGAWMYGQYGDRLLKICRE